MELNMEPNPVKPELQQPEKALNLDTESTGNNLLSKTTQNEKNSDSMELEEETLPQNNQPAENPDV